MTVLRPLEFVNFPSKNAMEAIFCIIFARVFLPKGTALNQMFDVAGFVQWSEEKFAGTFSPLEGCATYSMNARYGYPSSRFCCCTSWHFSSSFLRLLGDSLFDVPYMTTYWLVTVKSSMRLSYCSLKARMPRCVTLCHQTRWRSEQGFLRPSASVDHIFSISSSSRG